MNAPSNIVAISNSEIDQVDGGIAWIPAVALVVGIAAGVVYLGGELHDATCTAEH